MLHGDRKARRVRGEGYAVALIETKKEGTFSSRPPLC